MAISTLIASLINIRAIFSFPSFLSVQVSPGFFLPLSPPAISSYLLRRFLTSFHGDTNGLQSIPLLKAVHATAAAESASLLLGLDANVHEVRALTRPSWND